MRPRAMNPYTRVMLVTIAFVVAGAVTMGIAAVLDRPNRERLEFIQHDVEPSAAIMNHIARVTAKANRSFNRAIYEPDADERAGYIADAAGANDGANVLVTELLSRPEVLENEGMMRAELQRAYDASIAAGTRAGLKFAGGTDFNDPETIEAIRDAITNFRTNEEAIRALDDGYQEVLDREIAVLEKETNRVRQIGFGLGTLLFSFAFGFALFMYVQARRQHSILESDQATRAAETARNEYETRLQRALDLAETEDEVYPVVAEALSALPVRGVAELLIADSSRAHFRRVASTTTDETAGCPVAAPTECPAARRGQPIAFTSSEMLDSCRHLRDRPEGACSALCNPVRIAGGTMGVVHVTGPVDRPPAHELNSFVDLVTRKTAERIGMLRAFNQAETQARTDSLTGLLNRRSVEAEARRLLENDHPYVIAYGDLDLFKRVNDVHGHAAGDRALRVVARALRDSVRPSDLVARYGGEEFLIVLPDCDTRTAHDVVERVRQRFCDYLDAAAAPGITISFGIAGGDHLAELDDVIARADSALLAAKAAGRDRVIIADDNDDAAEPARRTGGAPAAANSRNGAGSGPNGIAPQNPARPTVDPDPDNSEPFPITRP